jgi:hypothetical protein
MDTGIQIPYEDVRDVRMDEQTCPLPIERGWHMLWTFSIIYYNMLEYAQISFLWQRWALSGRQLDVILKPNERTHKETYF